MTNEEREAIQAQIAVLAARSVEDRKAIVSTLERRVVADLEALIRYQDHESDDVAEEAAMAIGRIVAMAHGV